jgi:hypothetical protein
MNTLKKSTISNPDDIFLGVYRTIGTVDFGYIIRPDNDSFESFESVIIIGQCVASKQNTS